MAKNIIKFFPPHETYVEAFGGALSVLVHKKPCRQEIINDLDGELVNLYRVWRNNPGLICQLLELTTYSREEMRRAYDCTDSSPEQMALATIIKNNMGRGKAFHRTGLRIARNANTGPVKAWAKMPKTALDFHRRIKKCLIENKPAIEVIEYFDSKTTLHYVDPPYVPSTRRYTRLYRHEMTDVQHKDLVRRLISLEGMVVLSGYNNDLYNSLGWKRFDFKARTNANTDAVESVWVNRAVQENLNQIEMEFDA